MGPIDKESGHRIQWYRPQLFCKIVGPSIFLCLELGLIGTVCLNGVCDISFLFILLIIWV